MNYFMIGKEVLKLEGFLFFFIKNDLFKDEDIYHLLHTQTR